MQCAGSSKERSLINDLLAEADAIRKNGVIQDSIQVSYYFSSVSDAVN